MGEQPALPADRGGLGVLPRREGLLETEAWPSRAAGRRLQDCDWSEWDLWTACPAECGGGVQTRNQSRPLSCARPSDAAEQRALGRGVTVDERASLQLVHDAKNCSVEDCWPGQNEITPFCRFTLQVDGWLIEEITAATRDLMRAVLQDRVIVGLTATAQAGQEASQEALSAGITTRVAVVEAVAERVPGEAEELRRIIPGLTRFDVRIVAHSLAAAEAVTATCLGDSFIDDVTAAIMAYPDSGHWAHGDGSLRLTVVPEEWTARFTVNEPTTIDNDRLFIEDDEFLATILVGVVVWPLLAVGSCYYWCKTLHDGIWPADSDDDGDVSAALGPPLVPHWCSTDSHTLTCVRRGPVLRLAVSCRVALATRAVDNLVQAQAGAEALLHAVHTSMMDAMRARMHLYTKAQATRIRRTLHQSNAS